MSTCAAVFACRWTADPAPAAQLSVRGWAGWTPTPTPQAVTPVSSDAPATVNTTFRTAAGAMQRRTFLAPAPVRPGRPPIRVTTAIPRTQINSAHTVRPAIRSIAASGTAEPDLRCPANCAAISVGPGTSAAIPARVAATDHSRTQATRTEPDGFR